MVPSDHQTSAQPRRIARALRKRGTASSSRSASRAAVALAASEWNEAELAVVERVCAGLACAKDNSAARESETAARSHGPTTVAIPSRTGQDLCMLPQNESRSE